MSTFYIIFHFFSGKCFPQQLRRYSLCFADGKTAQGQSKGQNQDPGARSSSLTLQSLQFKNPFIIISSLSSFFPTLDIEPKNFLQETYLNQEDVQLHSDMKSMDNIYSDQDRSPFPVISTNSSITKTKEFRFQTKHSMRNCGIKKKAVNKPFLFLQILNDIFLPSAILPL